MINLAISDDAWDAAASLTGDDARLLLRSILAMSPCVLRAIYERSGTDFALLSKTYPVAVLSDAALKAALARYGNGKPIAILLDDAGTELKDRLWRNHRAWLREFRGPAGGLGMYMAERRRRNAALYSALRPRPFRLF